MLSKTTTYIKEAITEIKKVTWPTKKETQTYTWLVIGITIAIATYLGSLDYFFNWLLEQYINNF